MNTLSLLPSPFGVNMLGTNILTNKVNKILALKTEIRELNWEYLKLKSELVHNSMYSTVESKLSVQELGLRGQKPVQVIVKD